MHSIAVAGSVTVDVMASVVSLPQPGRLEHATAFELGVGGVPGNCGAVLGKLGVRAHALARVGDDPLGEFIARDLGRFADVSGIVVDPDRSTSTTMVLAGPDGERSFVYHAGANAAFGAGDIDLAGLASAGVGHLHVGYATLLPELHGRRLAAVLAEANALGISTSIDVTWDPTGEWWLALDGVLASVDLFAPNRAEAEAMTGESDPLLAARSLLSAGVRQTVAVTLDADGCLAVDASGEVFEVPSPQVEVVDTTGAGDAFIAGWLAARAAGLATGDALRRAVRVGADAVTCRRAVEGVRADSVE